ncbi:MAG: DUF502 domain-containing protein [Thiohalophilus sp.]|jgi:uncharacterized membrane protein
MSYLWKTVFKGLATVLPVALTLYLIYWLGLSIEKGLHPVITTVISEEKYIPGMGLVAGVVLLFFVGLMVNAFIIRQLIWLVEKLLERIPLVKSIYGSLHDFMDYFAAGKSRGGLKQVVLVSMGEAHLIGFMTRDRITDLPGITTQNGDEIVAVYMPFSYQIGGYTLYLPRSRVTPVDIPMEEAMRRVLTAELSKSAPSEKT